MKVIIITVDDARKTELKGAEKLTKNDILILMSAKNKTDMPTLVKEALEEVKAETEYVKLDSASDVTAAYAYYAGLHTGKNHQVFIVAPDKTKLPAVIAKQIKIYTSFASVLKADSGSASTTGKSTSKSASSAGSKTAKKVASGNAETLLTNTISNLTGAKKSDVKKLIKTFKDAKNNDN